MRGDHAANSEVLAFMNWEVSRRRAMLGAGDGVALELAAVDPLDDRTLGDLAELGHLAGRVRRLSRVGTHI
jgi:hypothetical protein